MTFYQPPDDDFIEDLNSEIALLKTEIVRLEKENVTLRTLVAKIQLPTEPGLYIATLPNGRIGGVCLLTTDPCHNWRILGGKYNYSGEYNYANKKMAEICVNEKWTLYKLRDKNNRDHSESHFGFISAVESNE